MKDEQGNRLGSMCILDANQGADSTKEKQMLLKELAAEAERQIKVRKALLAKERYRCKYKFSKLQTRECTRLSIGGRRKLSLSREQQDENTSVDTNVVFEKDSASEPRFQSNRATRKNVSHLPSNFYGFADMVGALLILRLARTMCRALLPLRSLTCMPLPRRDQDWTKHQKSRIHGVPNV